MERVDISVVIPVYNVEAYVGECLESVLAQKNLTVEIICVDDGSADASAAVVAEYAQKYGGITLVRHEKNRGLSAARNTGMRYAAGKYIYFLDSDDLIREDAFDVLFCQAESNAADVIYFDTEVLCEEEFLWEKIRNYRSAHKYHYAGVSRGDALFQKMKKKNDLDTAVWRQFWRLEALQKTGIQFLEGIYHEDNLFSIQTMLLAERAMCLNRRLHIYRYRENSITSAAVTEKHLQSMCKVYAGILKFWMEHEFDVSVDEQLFEYLRFIVKRVNRYRNALQEEPDLGEESGMSAYERHMTGLLTGRFFG